MDMKKLIESMDHIEECGMTEMPAAMPAPEMDKGNPVTVNVSMNASGKEHVADLLDMMKNAGLGGAEPVGAKMLSPRMDMERLSAMMGEPADGLDDREMDLPAPESYSAGDENAEGMVSNCCSAPVQDERNGTGRCSACGEGCEAVAEEAVEEAMDGEITKDSVKKSALELLVDIAKTSKQYKGEITDDQVHYLGSLVHDFDMAGIETEKYSEIEKLFRTASKTNKADMSMIQPAYAQAKTLDEEAVEEGDYANEPDAQYGDMSDAIPDGNDLNRKKKAYAATQDGDNPMAVENIKAALYAALTEKKKTMVKGPDGKMVPDYAADGKGKDDLSKGKKDTKTTEGRGKVMAGRGRGKDKLMAGRGRGKKK